MIEKVLKIRKAPTKTEIPANASSTVVKKENPSLMSALCWAASSAPVFASIGPGSSALMRSESAAASTPSAASTVTSSISPTLPVISCASASVKTARLAPPRGTPVPNCPIPDSV